MVDPLKPAAPVAKPGDPLDLEESVAGEEDPGASIDIANTPATPGPTAPPGSAQPDAARPGPDKTSGRSGGA